jgi:GntR family transcriptional regulator
MDTAWALPIDPTRPIYAQIVDHLVGRIARGGIAPGEALRSARSLALALRVNPNTVQRPYRDMESLGVAESHPCQGTFARSDHAALSRLHNRAAEEILERVVVELRGLEQNADAIASHLARVLDARRSNAWSSFATSNSGTRAMPRRRCTASPCRCRTARRSPGEAGL